VTERERVCVCVCVRERDHDRGASQMIWFDHKLIVTQLVRKFHVFHGTRKFITVSPRDRRHWSPSQPISLRSILVLSSHLVLVLYVISSFQGFLVFISHLSHACYMPHPVILLDSIKLKTLHHANL